MRPFKMNRLYPSIGTGNGRFAQSLVGHPFAQPHHFADFIVQVDAGHLDPLNLIVEIKGFRGEDAKEKANTMRA